MEQNCAFQAIEFDPNEAPLFSNRSLCWLRAGQGERALEDARACRALRPDWAKACFREGAALRLLQVCRLHSCPEINLMPLFLFYFYTDSYRFTQECPYL
jgi:tetratricopeptide (TPR) repeat protein